MSTFEAMKCGACGHDTARLECVGTMPFLSALRLTCCSCASTTVLRPEPARLEVSWGDQSEGVFCPGWSATRPPPSHPPSPHPPSPPPESAPGSPPPAPPSDPQADAARMLADALWERAEQERAKGNYERAHDLKQQARKLHETASAKP